MKKDSIKKDGLIYLNLTKKKKSDLIKEEKLKKKKKTEFVCKVCKNKIDIKKRCSPNKDIVLCELCNNIICNNIIKFDISKEKDITDILSNTPKELTIENSKNRLLIKKNISPIIGIITILLSLIILLMVYNNEKLGRISLFIVSLFIFFLMYGGLASFFSKIYIKITKKDFDFYTAPIPIFINKKIKSNNIAQLYVKLEKKSTISHIEWFRLKILLKNNKTITLMKSSNPKTLLFLEKLIEYWLNIEDIEMMEEIKKN